MAIKVLLCSLSVLLVLVVFTNFASAGIGQFLRDSLYSIYSNRDDAALTLSDSVHSAYKMVTVEKWKNLDTQKWIVEDFQAMGKYHFTPLVHNTSSNVVTYQFTKNVYSYKRQWIVKLISTQRYQVQNPESGLCLTYMGLHKQVEEADCDIKHPMSQVWRFRLLQK